MTTPRDTGGPAFPQSAPEVTNWDGSLVGGGMTLRDWFAGQALAGSMQYLLQNPSEAIAHGLLPEEWAASIAYGFADALLAARSK